MVLAEECYLAWRSHFETTEWKGARGSTPSSASHLLPVLHDPRGRGADVPSLLLVARPALTSRWQGPALARASLRTTRSAARRWATPSTKRQLSGQDREGGQLPDQRFRDSNRASGCWSRPSVTTRTRCGLARPCPSATSAGLLLQAACWEDKKLYGTAFNTDDCMVAVQWYERRNGERRKFSRGERMIDVAALIWRPLMFSPRLRTTSR